MSQNEVRYIKQGALEPNLQVELRDGNGPMDVSTATAVTLNLYTAADVAIVSGGSCTFTSDGTDGLVEYAFVAGDTDTLGRHNFEIDVVWPGGRRTTYPDNGHAHLHVTKHLTA